MYYTYTNPTIYEDLASMDAHLLSPAGYCVNGGTAGSYELSVQYDGKELGTINVTISSDPYLKITEGDEEKELIFKKNVQVGDSVQLGVKAFNGSAIETNPTVTWEIPEEYAGMADVDATGKVTFKVDRANFFVKASYDAGDKTVTDTIQIIITPDNYLTPGTSTNDFPQYPNEGAIRYDKTAESVGNFSETGVTQVELSPTAAARLWTSWCCWTTLPLWMTFPPVCRIPAQPPSPSLRPSLRTAMAPLTASTTFWWLTTTAVR